MRFAICNELSNDRPPRDTMQPTRSIGDEGWEIAPFTLAESIEDFTKTQRKQCALLAANEGLEIVGLHWLLAKTSGFHRTHGDFIARKCTEDYFGQLTSLCHDLGGKVLVLRSPEQRDLADGVLTVQRIERAAEETSFPITAARAQRLVDAVASPKVKLLLDVKVMSTDSILFSDFISSHRNYLVHFHVNDPNREGRETGAVDFGPIIETLKHENYDRWVSVGVFYYSPGVDNWHPHASNTRVAYGTLDRHRRCFPSSFHCNDALFKRPNCEQHGRHDLPTAG